MAGCNNATKRLGLAVVLGGKKKKKSFFKESFVAVLDSTEAEMSFKSKEMIHFSFKSLTYTVLLHSIHGAFGH